MIVSRNRSCGNAVIILHCEVQPVTLTESTMFILFRSGANYKGQTHVRLKVLEEETHY